VIEQVEMTNFGPLKNLKWGDLGSINLIVGGNSCGKTFILKALYSAMRTIEEYRRGDSPKELEEILLERLHWTFQADRVGDLVSKGSDGALRFRMCFGGNEFTYTFGRDTKRKIASITNTIPPRVENSIFLPAKEVLSLQSVILESRERDMQFGFDDTYYDLARALRQPAKKGKNFSAFAEARSKLEALFGGKVEYDEAAGKWSFRNNGHRYALGTTAEGVKKIAILDTLLGNRYLLRNSVVFLDEPESALHPKALLELLEIVASLADSGIQFFMASHSYFVVKKLFLIAQERDIPIPILSNDDAGWSTADLRDGIPDNGIIRESIDLYRSEVDLALS
jgi:predicted ATPase